MYSRCQTNLNINTLDVINSCLYLENIYLLLRDTSLPTLNAAFFSIAGIADTEIRQSAHAVRASAHAYRYASRACDITRIVSVSRIAGALIRSSALAVQARMLAHACVRFIPIVSDASTRIGIFAESRIAYAHVRGDAPFVRSATVSALWAGHVGRC